MTGNCLPDIIKDTFAPSTLSFYNDSISKVFPSSRNTVHRVPAYQPPENIRLVFVIFSVGLWSVTITPSHLTPVNTSQIIPSDLSLEVGSLNSVLGVGIRASLPSPCIH